MVGFTLVLVLATAQTKALCLDGMPIKDRNPRYLDIPALTPLKKPFVKPPENPYKRPEALEENVDNW